MTALDSQFVNRCDNVAIRTERITPPNKFFDTLGKPKLVKPSDSAAEELGESSIETFKLRK